MAEENEFLTLLKRVRAGDQTAAAILVREYEPAIRRVIRFHLTDLRLRRTFDSMDVCQSVLANFFARVATDQFDLTHPEQLFKLLVAMARNHLVDLTRRQKAARRDNRRLEAVDSQFLQAIVAPQTGPSSILANREMLEKIQKLLTEEERFLVEQRSLGREWAAIAEEVGGSADSIRMRLTRALNRVAQQLGLEAPES